jgi:ferredoxin
MGLCAGLAALGMAPKRKPEAKKPGDGEEYWLDPDECIECDACVDECPTSALKREKKIYVIDQAKCTQCGDCLKVCPVDCIKIRKKK